jgi:hypothetical protein
MTAQELREIASFLNKLYDDFASLKSPQIVLGWLTDSPIIFRPAEIRNDETQLLHTDNFTWIANNNNAATTFQARYCSLANIKTIAELQTHMPAFNAGMRTLKISKKAVTSTTTASSPFDLSTRKIRKPDSGGASSSSSSSSSAPPFHSGVVEIKNTTQASDSAHIHGKSSLGTVTVETQLAFVHTGYTACEGDEHTNYHAEQRLLAALSMLRPDIIANRSVTIYGAKPPCGTCAPHLKIAKKALESIGATLSYDTSTGKGRGDAVDMHADYFSVPHALSTIQSSTSSTAAVATTSSGSSVISTSLSPPPVQ